MYADDPVDENCAHILIYVALSSHVKSVRLCLLFSCLHMRLNFFAVMADMIDIRNRCFVNFANFRGHMVLNTALVGLQFIVQANLRQFVP